MQWWLILVIIIICILILSLIYRSFRKTPENLYRKARKLHGLGEKYNELGDIEIANEYYKDAEDFRKKAIELEKEEYVV